MEHATTPTLSAMGSLETPVLWMKSSLEQVRLQDNWQLNFYTGFLKTCKLFAVATRDNLLAVSAAQPPPSSVEALPVCRRMILEGTMETGDLISPTLFTIHRGPPKVFPTFPG